MICAWQQLLGILPRWLATEVDHLGKDRLQELRLRQGQAPELYFGGKSHWLQGYISGDDLNFVVNTASRYSPWATATVKQGYLTAPGGHRIGLCGETVMRNGFLDGMRQIRSLNIRVARDFPGIGKKAADGDGSILILGPPGAGKTTLLRDICRVYSRKETVCVVDERGELFPEGMDRGMRMDVLTGCSKAEGIDLLLRTMGPDRIAVDEITSEGDCDALIRAGWCGVSMIATAHASSVTDLQKRTVYRTLYECGIFDRILILRPDKTWYEERAK